MPFLDAHLFTSTDNSKCKKNSSILSKLPKGANSALNSPFVVLMLAVSERYIELFEYITGDKFIKEDVSDVINRVEKNILNYLEA